MRITAILETSIKAGGAHNQSINALLQMNRICGTEFDFIVIVFDSETKKILQGKGLNAVLVTYTFIEKVQNWFMKRSEYRWFFNEKELYYFEKYLIELQTDLVYFTGPSLLSLQLKKLNYIFTLFDLAHREYPEFPEVREFQEFQKREHLYSQVISQSFITLTDSVELSEKVTRYYGIDPSRLISMPYSPSPDLEIQPLSESEIREYYQLPSKYFYYPAQYWPHKNHIRILEAIFLLKKKGLHYCLVLSGGDKGNLDYIKRETIRLDLQENVYFLGLVPSNHIKPLYQGSIAVVMPSYFGPTNIPPLEAWMLGVPLIYSNHLSDQAGEAALLVDPDNSESIASAMIDISNINKRKEYVDKGRKRLEMIKKERDYSERRLLEKLMTFEKRRKCWIHAINIQSV